MSRRVNGRSRLRNRETSEEPEEEPREGELGLKAVERMELRNTSKEVDSQLA